MGRHVFLKLVQTLCLKSGLTPTKHVSSQEQVAIFLRIAVTGLGNREQQERFQRSGETISKCLSILPDILCLNLPPQVLSPCSQYACKAIFLRCLC